MSWPDPKFILICCLIGLMAPPVFAQKYEPTWESLDSRSMPEWFNEAKFGIFIHWGVYSVPAWRPLSEKKYASYAEWYYARVIDDLKNGGDVFHRKNFGDDFEYRQFGPMFRAELYDPDDWADLFKKAGARYVVLTSKHHDGYCLWPTSSPYKTDWNSGAIGPKRDLLGDLAKAVRTAGLKMGLYYSIIEWESIPTKRVESGWYLNRKTIDKYRIPLDSYVDNHLLPQLKELVSLYQPSLIFSDGGEWDFGEDFWKTREFLAWLYNKAPNKDEVVVNDRWCKGMPGKHGDYYSSEYQDTDAIGVFHPWEESRGIGGSYGFNRAENLEDYRTSEELVYELIDIAHKGGNLLLNVGPTADGRIPVIMQQRLMDIGGWLRINGEAIYGTRAWTPKGSLPAEVFSSLRFTQKGDDLYIHCLGWPKGDITVPVAGLRPGSIRLLGVDKPVEWEPTEDG
ncbi:MAG: alpha-L-fucosidase, partial [Candidatus Aminicenantes bacterium]|nr:alpha-L-fucosidase [Candidatus Aminicenantes bacterium]